MMTSIWYSRYFRIASVTTAGTTASGTAADTASEAMTSGPLAGPPVAVSLSGPSSWATSITASANASHFTCCRTSGPPLRKRVTSAATTMASSGRDARPSAVSVPRSRPDHTGPSEATPSGFGNSTDPPGAGMRTSRGTIANPVISSTATTATTQAAGRHREDGSLPSGKSRNVPMRVMKIGTKSHSANSPTSGAAGSVPGCLMPATPYPSATVSRAISAPRPSISHPIRFAARRTMSTPRVA